VQTRCLATSGTGMRLGSLRTSGLKEVPLSPAVRFASPGLTIDSNIVRWHLSQMNVVATVRPSTVIQSRITVEVVTMSKKSPSDLPLSAFQFQYARSSTPTHKAERPPTLVEMETPRRKVHTLKRGDAHIAEDIPASMPSYNKEMTIRPMLQQTSSPAPPPAA
jgi:hypothetical protein